MEAQLCFYNETDLKNFAFYKFPKALLFDEKYKNMSDSAKILYMLFYDRLFMSQENHHTYSDENGILYIRYNLKSIMQDTNWSRNKVNRALDCLTEYNLIVQERESLGLAYRIYVSKLIVDNSGVGSKRTQGGFKTNPGVGSKRTPNKTNIL